MSWYTFPYNHNYYPYNIIYVTAGTGCTAEQTIVATTTAQYLTSPAFPNEYTGWVDVITDYYSPQDRPGQQEPWLGSPPPILQIMILKLSSPRRVISKESVQQKWIDELWFRKQLSTCLFESPKLIGPVAPLRMTPLSVGLIVPYASLKAGEILG